MREVALSNPKKQRAYKAIEKALAELSSGDAVDVLAHQLTTLAQHKLGVNANPREVPTVVCHRSHGRVSSIEADSELEEFILSMRGYRSIQQMQQACSERFGKARAPSKSAIHRYIQKKTVRGRGALL